MKVAIQAMCLCKQCVWATVFRRDRVDDRSPSKTLWWGEPTDA